MEGVAGDVESEQETEHEEQLSSCDTTSVENLIKGISKKIIKHKKELYLGMRYAQFLLNLSA